jgi:hypothetical protein
MSPRASLSLSSHSRVLVLHSQSQLHARPLILPILANDALQLPQLFANYKAKSADGLSMAFLVVWLLGDITNLIG